MRVPLRRGAGRPRMARERQACSRHCRRRCDAPGLKSAQPVDESSAANAQGSHSRALIVACRANEHLLTQGDVVPRQDALGFGEDQDETRFRMEMRGSNRRCVENPEQSLRACRGCDRI
jgi:hypothetical protein